VCGRGWVYGRGLLSIGNNTWLSPGVIFYTHLEAPIAVGSNCDIGPAVEFITGGHIIGFCSRRAGQGTAKPIVINDGCWIGPVHGYWEKLISVQVLLWPLAQS
jgi:maltose O-acetyltransferase